MRVLNFSVLFASIFILGACIESEVETSPFDAKELIQAEGYLPLSPDNYWNFRNYIVDITDTGGIEYRSDYFDTEEAVVKVNKTTQDSKKKLDYEFAPINSAGLIGNLLGNVSQVYKDEQGNYFRSEIREVDVLRGNEVASKTIIDFKDEPFLKDDIKLGDILDKKVKTINFNVGTRMTIDYETGSYVSGNYNKIPIKYASAVGIDDFLLNYTDIVQVTSYIKILSMRISTNNVRAIYNGFARLEPGGKATLNFLTGNARLAGTLCLVGLFDYCYPDIRLTAEDLTAYGVAEALVCESNADIFVDEVFDIPMEIISNQYLIEKHVFYAWNVGPIKRIITTSDIAGKIRIEQENEFSLPIELKAVDPFCISNNNLDNNNILKLNVKLDAFLNDFQIDIPLKIGLEATVVQNLRSHYIRKKN